MLSDLFNPGRLSRPAAAIGTSAQGKGGRPGMILSRLARLDRLSGRTGPAATDARPDAPPDPRPDASPGSRSAVLSSASDAERQNRLRASFEDDLAHFLRAAASPAPE
ncbi:MAG: hypothetical protein MUF73_03610 [Rhodobacteraceae bacterium]|jgi:hypothetical protein|nr:hypothetical protein [Paracoccaceae bacterium]